MLRVWVSWYKVKDDDECSSDESIKKGPPAKLLVMVSSDHSKVQVLFANVDDAKDLTWKTDERNYDGMLCHLADSSQWKKINRMYPKFEKEA